MMAACAPGTDTLCRQRLPRLMGLMFFAINGKDTVTYEGLHLGPFDLRFEV